MIKWSQLNNKKRSIINSLLKEWEKRLKKKSFYEESYHKYLAEYAGLFLADYNTSIVISKLKLGCNYETDFLVIRDGYSKGTMYELIEIESPHSKPYNKTGEPSARLTKAIQQIHDWKNWLQENRNSFSILFPNDNKRIIKDSNLQFKIIIGTRENSKMHIDKRNQLSHETKISIRSFDSLTDNLRRKTFNDILDIFSAELDNIDPKIRNDLANPFYKAINDGAWRNRKERIDTVHFIPMNYKFILENRKYNKYYNSFIIAK